MFYQLFESLKKSYLKVQEKSERLENLNKKIDILDSINGESENLKLIEAEKAVPSRKELAPWLNEVNILADKNGLLKLGINIKPGKVATDSAALETNNTEKKGTPTKTAKTVTTKEDKEAVTFAVTLGGSLENMKQFLLDLEGSKPLLSVTSIKSKLQEDGSYRFDLRISAPIKGVTQKGDIIAEPVPALTDALEAIFKKISRMISYVGISVPTVPTGVEDPFK